MKENIIYEISDLTARYGNLTAIQGISLEFYLGESVGIFGHNGCGKSTLIKSLVGAIEDVDGSIKFMEKEIIPGDVSSNILHGIGMVPQTSNVFPTLAVEQCLKIAGLRNKYKAIDEIYNLFPLLKERKLQKAGSMSGGEQQILAVAMSLMTSPKIILLDEPTAGLSPKASRTVLEALDDINKRLKTTIVVIEQNVLTTLDLVERAIILRNGRVVFDDKSEVLKSSKDLWSYF
jgi:branched-chain amino acid transport system ATP-binding protein|tara:strand:- start:798 stop:1496 length:699 start_codon:yes stop_codon:yes gene_type:complete